VTREREKESRGRPTFLEEVKKWTQEQSFIQSHSAITKVFLISIGCASDGRPLRALPQGKREGARSKCPTRGISHSATRIVRLSLAAWSLDAIVWRAQTTRS